MTKDTSSVADTNSSTEFPTPPKGFPKTFLDPPNPLPIVGDRFLDPKITAYFWNISGSCHLCNKTVLSHLVDHHLILCSGLDRQSLENFAKSAMKEFSIMKNKAIEASLLYSKFELNEATVPNDFLNQLISIDHFL